MKRLLVFAFLLFCTPSIAGATCTSSGSSPTTYTCSIVDAATLINGDSYAANDIINVNAGSGTWSVTITKGLVLTGAGVGVTNLSVSDSSNIITFNPATSNDDPLEISGFSFDTGSTVATAIVLGGLGTNEYTKIKIYDNSFTSTGSSGLGLIFSQGNMFGVIYNNTFSTNFIISRASGADASGWSGLGTWQTETLSLGTAKALYFEDNIMTGDAVNFYGGWGGREVVRYNSMNSGSSQAVVDMHGTQAGTSDGCATQISELYGNIVTAATYTQGVTQRGGRLLVLFNSWGVHGCDDWRQYSDALYAGGGCGAYDKTGLSGGAWPDLWQINNRVGSGTICSASVTEDVASLGLASDVTLFNYVGSPPTYDGSTGTGCGTLANRPVSPALANTAYFATDLTCSSVSSANVGPSPSTPITGTVYTWNGSSWQSFWTPYTYPHPLRNEATSGNITLGSGSAFKLGAGGALSLN